MGTVDTEIDKIREQMNTEVDKIKDGVEAEMDKMKETIRKPKEGRREGNRRPVSSKPWLTTHSRYPATTEQRCFRDGLINNEPCTMLLDTGATRTILDLPLPEHRNELNRQP
ncbi:hypothetical protein JTB14_034567 [Gonioctena quinquepunctata]|nr:hypothetical protein JTB14_034567 [Gonioctena quinquepunctata]